MAYDFDGVDDRISATITALDADWTIATWFKADTAGETNNGFLIITEGALAAPGQLIQFLSSSVGRIYCFQEMALGDAFSTTDAFATMGTWYCLTATFTAADSKVRIYKGTLTTAMAEVTYVGQATGSGTRATGPNVVLGNNTATTRTFDGNRGRTLVANRLLTLTEMESFRNGTIPTGSIRAYWPLSTDANDASGNGANGTISGATQVADPAYPGASVAKSGSATISATSSVVTSGRKALTSVAAVSATSSIAATGAKSAAPPVTVSAASSVTSTGRKSTSQSATVAAVSSVTVSGAKRSTGAAAVSATSSVVASGFVPELHDGAASIATTSTVNTTGAKGSRVSVSLASTSSATAQGLRTSRASSTLTASAVLFAVGTKAGEGPATVTAASTVVAAGRSPTAYRRRSVATPRRATAATPRRSTVAAPRRSL